MKQKPRVSCYSKVFTVIKIKLTFSKPETHHSSFFDIFVLLPLFLFPIPSPFPLAIGETDIYPYFYICTFTYFYTYIYICLNLCINMSIYKQPCKRKQSSVTKIHFSGSAVLSNHQEQENPKAQEN